VISQNIFDVVSPNTNGPATFEGADECNAKLNEIERAGKFRPIPAYPLTSVRFDQLRLGAKLQPTMASKRTLFRQRANASSIV
jgi:hypothetical protein